MTKDKAPKYNIDLKVEMTEGAWKWSHKGTLYLLTWLKFLSKSIGKRSSTLSVRGQKCLLNIIIENNISEGCGGTHF